MPGSPIVVVRPASPQQNVNASFYYPLDIHRNSFTAVTRKTGYYPSTPISNKQIVPQQVYAQKH